MIAADLKEAATRHVETIREIQAAAESKLKELTQQKQDCEEKLSDAAA